MMSNVGYDKQQPETIQQMFGSIASRYDRANAILSFNLHRYWNKQLAKHATNNSPGTDYLDLCSGTGDIAFCIAEEVSSPSKICLLDFCPEMLEIAKTKAPKSPHEFTYLQGDAQELPFDDNSFDSITISYGIRNIKSPERCIKECKRVLRDRGVLSVLELTRPTHPIMKFGHQCYLKGILPIIGKFVTENQQAYEYLCSSIHHFVSPDELSKIMKSTGFDSVSIKPLTGGIATLVTALNNEFFTVT
jgi:demethylmenaquinone methyltransferase / 2-methoxy-6-polyprenyl-1,4-benzoquinol methylase